MSGAVRNGKNLLLNEGVKKWAYNLTGYNKYGLWHDDCLQETPVIKEALRRLPQHIVDERTFRIVRALQLSCNKVILPQEEWTRMEEETKYLTPYVEQIEKEIREKEEWDKS